jgi:hypothetical protein
MTLDEMDKHLRDFKGLCNRCRSKQHAEDFHKKYDLKKEEVK